MDIIRFERSGKSLVSSPPRSPTCLCNSPIPIGLASVARLYTTFYPERDLNDRKANCTYEGNGPKAKFVE